MNKKVQALAVAGVLTVGVVGGTLAWFTSQDSVKNTFNTASSNGENGKGIRIEEEFVEPKNMLPGDVVNKDVQVSNTATYDQFIRVKLTPKFVDPKSSDRKEITEVNGKTLDIKKIELNYMGIYKLNYNELYKLLQKDAPLAIFAILMNENMKSYYISEENSSPSTISIYKRITSLVSNKTELKEKLGYELKIFKGETEAYWKDIEPKGKSFMIIDMEPGNYVRNAGVFGEEISSADVESKFLILDGIDYKSNSNYKELLYMEV
ncbi:BsaA family SipW-dependent biofilm matrix protein [Burkholderia pseudomallei]